VVMSRATFFGALIGGAAGVWGLGARGWGLELGGLGLGIGVWSLEPAGTESPPGCADTGGRATFGAGGADGGVADGVAGFTSGTQNRPLQRGQVA
jgi:hypothetical protein